MKRDELEEQLDKIDSSTAVECNDNGAFYKIAHGLNDKLEETREELEVVLLELQRMREGGELGTLSSVIYTDMNGVPNTLDGCLYWIQLHTENVYENLGGCLKSL